MAWSVGAHIHLYQMHAGNTSRETKNCSEKSYVPHMNAGNGLNDPVWTQPKEVLIFHCGRSVLLRLVFSLEQEGKRVSVSLTSYPVQNTCSEDILCHIGIHALKYQMDEFPDRELIRASSDWFCAHPFFLNLSIPFSRTWDVAYVDSISICFANQWVISCSEMLRQS